MKDLFYSGDEKILFWVAGYTYADNTQDVNDMILSLQEKSIEFITETGQAGKNRVVKTDYITKSRRYKYMRYFFCEGIEKEDVPENAFHITGENGWTMRKWLND